MRRRRKVIIEVGLRRTAREAKSKERDKRLVLEIKRTG